ncbi:hypothetical protein TcasGA2_TC010585 [Tribolium castaneum]|uniref:Uncharacterized protein n=1 Tax=Tribolium castaneum TaxID=7070 RepID=D6WUC1_TRICA|nr:hypothetical protein TcasGA2_TC010585 [Tribolium castaneum]
MASFDDNRKGFRYRRVNLITFQHQETIEEFYCRHFANKWPNRGDIKPRKKHHGTNKSRRKFRNLVKYGHFA